MENKQDFITAGYTYVATGKNENKCLCFRNENYPSCAKMPRI